MPADPRLASVILAVAVIAVAGLLALRQFQERRNRAPDLSEADLLHFTRQDIRRFLGAGVMMLIALAILVGSRINPRVGGRPQRWLFAGVWLFVFMLITMLLILAARDWLATFTYARRHRRALADERREALAALAPEPPSTDEYEIGQNGPPSESNID
jgi:hypothetical protein